MGRARLADQYERRAGRQRRRRCRGRHFLSGLQLDRERPEQRDERLDHLGNEVNLKLPAILASFSLTLGAPGVAAQWSVSAELDAGRAERKTDRKSTRLNSSHGYISYA